MRGLHWAMVACLVGPLSGQTTAPATKSAIDQATPKAALKTFARALDAGDRQRVLDLLEAQSDQEKKVAAATADFAEATARLRAAAAKAFGSEKARALGVDPTASDEAMKRIDAANESIDGDKAIIKQAEAEGPPLAMVRRDGSWRIPVSELSKDVEARDIDKNLADMNRQIMLMRELAGEVVANKYATAIDARQALDKRILSSSLPPIATTAPAAATKP